MAKTRKNIPWAGWAKEAPGTHQKTVMMSRCGKRCFLGTKKTFPICKKNTCRISKKGVYAAYVRSRQYRKKGNKYYKVASAAKKWLRKN
jgi:hypothetical protein